MPGSLVDPLPTLDAAVDAVVEEAVDDVAWVEPVADVDGVNDASNWSSNWPGSVVVPDDAVDVLDWPDDSEAEPLPP